MREQIGKYRILRPLGQGGEGVVYLAEDTDLGRRAALKRLWDHGGTGEEIRREAAFLRDLRHPMLPVVYELFRGGLCTDELPFQEEGWYLALEYIEGMSLHNYIRKEGGVREEQACLWGEALLDVLSYLHTRETPVIYRDLRPDNIMVCRDGLVRLVDFGAAAFQSFGEREVERMAYTRAFAAPEQRPEAGKRAWADERSDIYAFGKTLRYLVTGAEPTASYDALSPSCYNPLLSAELVEIIARCIAEAPKERYQVVSEIVRDLERRGRRGGVRKKEFVRHVEKQVCLAAAGNGNFFRFLVE